MGQSTFNLNRMLELKMTYAPPLRTLSPSIPDVSMREFDGALNDSARECAMLRVSINSFPFLIPVIQNEKSPCSYCCQCSASMPFTVLNFKIAK
jgi:hypothetical protein